MAETNIIKAIVSTECPHCGKEIFIENQMTPPVIGSLFTVELMNEAKKECVERIKTLSIEEEKKESVIKWIMDPNTIFAPGEVDSIVLSLLKPEK